MVGDRLTNVDGDMPLKTARRILHAALNEGMECPCCGQYCKIYKRRLNRGMAKWLIFLVRLWFATKQPVKSIEIPARSGEYGKLQHWGLIEQVKTGFWKPTPKGIQFVRGNRRVNEHVLLFNNEILGWSEEQITIYDALDIFFTFDDIMTIPVDNLAQNFFKD